MQESNFNVIIDTENYTTVIGESAKIDVGQAINNVQSGKAEIEAAVQDGKAAFNLNATAKTGEFNQNAIDKTGAFDSNATAKTGDFNTNATNKTTAFNNNATAKTGDFNDNYIAKKALIDAQVSIAEGAADLAKQWAIGEPSEPTGNSAKYWAEQASSSVTGLGARVTAIEGKIPADASSSNQLADKSWVGNQGYITGITSSDVTTALGYTPYNSTNPNGYISGITSGDVITALGYTPYDASNPNGYTSNVGTVTSVNNVSPVNGNVTLSIPAAQVNSDWDASSGVAQILNKPTIPTVNNATLTITQGGATKGTFTANASSDVTIDIDAGGGSSRNIGEIVASTIPLTDAGLHLLDGSLISGSGSYADFVTYIAGLVSDYPDLFDTEANWQTAVTTYGVCGKFVYDSVNGTVRLPKIIGFTESTIDTTVLGDLVEAGLPNITGEIAYKCMNGSREPSGAFTKISESTGVTPSGTNKDRNIEVDFNASLSNSIYGNSTTVQPQAIKVLYYIVIATSVKTEIEVDIDEIATDLNGKADVDLSNVNNTGKSLGAGWAMPSDTYDDLTFGASGATYTAPANGWFFAVRTNSAASNNYLRIINTTSGLSLSFISDSVSGGVKNVFVPAVKDDVIQIEYGSSSSATNLRFVYAVGSESEAQNV